MNRLLSPITNPAGLSSAAAAVYAAAVMITHAVQGKGIIDVSVIVAAAASVAALYTRTKVTPVADPHDGNGAPLKTQAPAGPAA